MPSRRNHVLTQNHDTKGVDRSAQYDQNLDQSPDSEDGNNPTIEHQPTEEKTGQGEYIEITPPERRSFSRNSGMNFNVAQVTSAVESDNELSDSLPLDYCSLWKTLWGFFFLSHSFMSFNFSNCYLVMFLLTLKTNPTTNHRIQTSIIMPGYKAFNKNCLCSSFWNHWREPRSFRTLCPGHTINQQNKIFAAGE